MYNLAKQELAKKLLGGSGAIMSMAVHSSGDHVLLGSQVASDPSMCWGRLVRIREPCDLHITLPSAAAAMRHKQASLRCIVTEHVMPLLWFLLMHHV